MPPVPITVGIGASAGGHEALQRIFTTLLSDCNLALVVVMHLPAEGPSLLADLIRHHTSMQVLTIEDGMPLRPNTVYVPPLGKELMVHEGRLRLQIPARDGQLHHPIDRFFTSLAADRGQYAVAVVLSGFGSDGSEGVKRVKEEGGIVLIQDPETAINPFMPQNAIATGAADAVLPAEGIADQLAQMTEGKDAFAPQTSLNCTVEEELHPLFALLKARTSHDFSVYKRNTVLRRIERRMVLNGASKLSEYLAIIEKTPQEAQSLCQELLIGVTSFFRDPEAFELLRSKIIPSLFRPDREEPVRIWHACCATGEEAYSVAMLIQEYLQKENLLAKVQIFATDLDETAIAKARVGLYADDIALEVGAERLKHFFTKSEEGWQVTKQLREMVVFAHHNLIKDPPFSRLDLLVCRNFLIYLNPDIQKLLIPLFHQVLNPKGYLFLGSSETVGLHSDLFTPFDKKWKIFMRRGEKSRVETLFPFSGPVRKLADIERSVRSAETQEAATVALADKLLMERYVPARVIINERNEVVHFSKQAGAYLLTPEGKPTRDLLKITREELRPALRAAIYKAFTHQKENEYRGIKVAADGGETTINIIVVPLNESPQAGKLALVIIEPASCSPVPMPPNEAAGSNDEASRNLLTSHLEEQLRVTGEQLQSTCEQLETSNERFTLANEELMTVNEELQSTNEELQSTNEELVTVNSELQRKMEELNQSNSDLENLFTSSEIAIFFLDKALSIKRFSPAMAALFHLIPADIGRSIHHLNSTLDWSNLPLDANSVLEKLVPVEREVRSLKDDRSFIMRVLPYRTNEGLTDGIVVTLIDISERKRAEVSLQESEKRFRTMANAMPQLAWIAHPDGSIFWYNQRWHDYTGTTPEQMAEWGWQSLHDPLVLPKVIERWQESISTGEPFEMEFPLRGADGGFRRFLTRIVPLKDAQGNILQWFGTNTDVTEIKEAEETLRRYELLADNSRDIIFFFRRDDGRILEANAAAMEAYGFNHEELLQLTLHDLRAVQDDELAAAQMDEADVQGLLFETVHRRQDGTTFPVEVSSRGATIGGTRMLLSVIRDITERKRAEKAVNEAAEQRRLALEAAGLGAWDYNFQTGEVFWDKQCRDTWGLPEGDRIDYASAIDLIHPEDRAATDEAVHQALSGANDGEYHREFRVVWPDGSQHWISSHGRVYTEKDGDLRRPVRFVGVNHEITENKHSEETRARLAAIIESSEDAIVAKDLNSIITSWNRGAERLFGYRAEEAVGQPITMLIPPELHDAERQMLQRLLAGERINHFETVRLTKDGRRLEVSLTVSPIKDGEGKIIGISKIVRDITELKQKEEELVLSEQRRSLALEAAQAGIWEWNLQTNENVWSNELWSLYGLEPNSCEPSHEEWRKIVHPDDLLQTEHLLQEAVLQGIAYSTEWRVKMKDGTERWLMSRGRPIKDCRDRVVRYLGIVIDITDRKRAEEEKKVLQTQLIQAQKMEAIGTLAGGIAHDFNNILGAVIGYAEMARDASPAGSEITHDLDRVLEAGERAANLVKQILAFSREANIEQIPVEPVHLVKEAIKLLRPALPATIAFEQQLDTATRPILADPTQIHQIVMNLCTNAFHAMEQTGGVLQVTLKDCELSPPDLTLPPGMPAGSFVVLSIGDTGTGIAPTIRDKIFEPYFTTKKVGKGTGMGLSIVHGIVTTLGGFITCESVLGEGTVFHVFFPALKREVASAIQSGESVLSGKEHILFIDDEEILAEMGQVMLERLGYKVTVLTSSIEALATFQNQPDQFDAVITDQTMPGITGIDLARRILQIRPGIPIILCTGYSSLVNEDQAKVIGIKGFIMKPMTKKDIARLLRKVLEDVPA